MYEYEVDGDARKGLYDTRRPFQEKVPYISCIRVKGGDRVPWDQGLQKE